MRRKKFLVMAAAGVAATILLSGSGMAADVNITVTDMDAADLEPESSAGSLPEPEMFSTAEEAGEPVNHAATPYPSDRQLKEQGGRSYLYKTYTVPATYDPTGLIEPDFSEGGYKYRYSETIHRDTTPMQVSKTVTEHRTVDSDTDDEATLVALLGSMIPYSDSEGYQGELYMVPGSLIVSATGQSSYSYTVTDTKRYTLPSNDMSQIPGTVQKNGLTLGLQTVDWSVSDTTSGGYSGIPSSYTATAVYSAPASGTRTSGYTATAAFSGSVYKELTGESTYTIVYEGEMIVIPYNFFPLIVAGVIVSGCVVAAIILWKLRRNTTIYTYQQGIPVQYKRVRINPKRPTLDLSKISDVPMRVVFDKGIFKALNEFDKRVFVIGAYDNFHIVIKGSLVQDLPAQFAPEGDWEEKSVTTDPVEFTFEGDAT